MSHRCPCHRHCRHLVPSRAGQYPAVKIEPLAELLGPLIDAGYHFDEIGLQIDPECEVHGLRPVPNGECSCSGDRASAVEFVAWLVANLHAGAARRIDVNEARQAGQRRHQGVLSAVS